MKKLIKVALVLIPIVVIFNFLRRLTISVLTFNLNDKQAASGNPCEIIGTVEIGKDGVTIKK